jgi:hypothetical protein
LQNIYTYGIGLINNLIINSLYLLPSADSFGTIGGNATRWLNIFTLQVSSGASDLTLAPALNVIPANASNNLGSLSNLWNSLFTQIVSGGAGTLALNGTAVISGAANPSLGSLVRLWPSVYTTTVNTNSQNLNLTIGTALGSNAVLPTSDNNCYLGSAVNRWGIIYTNNINSGAGNLILTPSSAVLPSGDLVNSLGNNANRWYNVSTTQVSAGSSSLTLDSTLAVVPSGNSPTLGSDGQSWPFIYAANWFPGALTTNAFLENNSLIPTLGATGGTITATYGSQGANWYRQGNMVFVTGQMQWTTMSGTGTSVYLATAWPNQFGVSFGATPVTLNYNGINSTAGIVLAYTLGTPGQITLSFTSTVGIAAPVPVSALNGTGLIQYSLTYYTTDLA